MKKLILAFFLFMSIVSSASAPPYNELIIPTSAPIISYSYSSYEPLIDAIYTWETGRDSTKHNLLEGAVGGLQIRQCRINHYNDLNGTNYTLEDCHNFELSKKVFLYFTNHDGAGHSIPNKSWEETAKNWNGSGRATEIYWENVKSLI